MRRIEQWLSRETAITIAVFIVGGHAAITMDGAITMIGAITMPRSWSLRRTGTITTIDLLLVVTREQEPGPSGRVLCFWKASAFPSMHVLLALSGHGLVHRTCPLSGVKRTSLFALQMSANDPKRTFADFTPDPFLTTGAGWYDVPRPAGVTMRRRDFIGLVGGAALAWPLGARAQEPGRVYRLAVVITAGRDELPTLAFFDELRVQGFVEGKNLEIIPDGFRIRNEQAATVVPAIVKAAPDAIVSAGDFITQKFYEATKSIPLVAMTEDMVAAGIARRRYCILWTC